MGKIILTPGAELLAEELIAKGTVKVGPNAVNRSGEVKTLVNDLEIAGIEGDSIVLAIDAEQARQILDSVEVEV